MTFASIERGPVGKAQLPPDDLQTKNLLIDIIAPQTPTFRIHLSNRSALFFGPLTGQPPTNRFDSDSGAFGVLYLGASFNAAFIETLVRNPKRRMISYEDIKQRSLSVVIANRSMRMVKLYGQGLSYHGTDNSISTGPYEPCGKWADALWQHPDKPDGIAYHSSHDSKELCYALFQRTDFELIVTDQCLLTERIVEIAALLNRYGKSLSLPLMKL